MGDDTIRLSKTDLAKLDKLGKRLGSISNTLRANVIGTGIERLKNLASKISSNLDTFADFLGVGTRVDGKLGGKDFAKLREDVAQVKSGLAGAQKGGSFGARIGGLVGGPLGAAVGAAVGLAAGAEFGAAIGKEQEENRREARRLLAEEENRAFHAQEAFLGRVVGVETLSGSRKTAMQANKAARDTSTERLRKAAQRRHMLGRTRAR